MNFKKNINELYSRTCNVCKDKIPDFANSCMSCGNKFSSNFTHNHKDNKSLRIKYSNFFEIEFPNRILDQNKKELEWYYEGEPLTKKWITETVLHLNLVLIHYSNLMIQQH